MHRLFLLLWLGLGTACAGRGMYSWGSYEEGLANLMAEQGAPEASLTTLSRDVARAQDAGRRVPPGVYAHLGYLLAQSGDLSGARAAFQEERRQFPESARLMDRLIARVEGPPPPPLPSVETSTVGEPGGLR